MQCSIRNASDVLGLSERSVFRLVDSGALRAQKIHGQFRVNRTELLEWAVACGAPVALGLLPDGAASCLGSWDGVSVSGALRVGGICRDVDSSSRSAALRAMVGFLPLPASVDREVLYRMYLSRDHVVCPGVACGIALPQVRHPVVLPVCVPQVFLCLLRTPLVFAGCDGVPIYAFWALITPTIRVHQALLSRLAFALRDSGLCEVIRSRGSAAQILAEVERVERVFSVNPVQD